MKTVTILSGGLDSTVLAYMLHAGGDEQAFLSFDYGQRHRTELERAHLTSLHLDSEFQVVELAPITATLFAGSQSSLVSGTAVPDGHYAEDTMKATIVPNRNMLMLSFAIAKAVAWGADRVATGVHAGDHFIYPDCRPDFVAALSVAAAVGNEGFVPAGFEVYAPFMQWSKAAIVMAGDELGVPFRDTWSCYKGGEIHCGRCGTCVERAEAFSLAQVDDPTEYADPDFWRQAVQV